METSVRIGTSGFSYGHWKEAFYPKGMKPAERLAYFATKFDTVEINASFYRPVSEKTLLAWKEAVPADFAFTMKAPKRITHIRRLRHCRSDLREMWRQFAALNHHLKCVLFQLPPSLKPDADLLARFLDMARAAQAAEGLESHIAVEFRARRWYEPEIFRVLDDYGAAPVLHDMPYKGGFWPVDLDGETLLKSGHLVMLPEDWIATTSSHFFYMRFHGTVNKRPWQEYGAEHLEPWVRIAGRSLSYGKPLFAYFNNDSNAASVRDAELFQGMLRQDGYLEDGEEQAFTLWETREAVA